MTDQLLELAEGLQGLIEDAPGGVVTNAVRLHPEAVNARIAAMRALAPSSGVSYRLDEIARLISEGRPVPLTDQVRVNFFELDEALSDLIEQIAPDYYDDGDEDEDEEDDQDEDGFGLHYGLDLLRAGIALRLPVLWTGWALARRSNIHNGVALNLCEDPRPDVAAIAREFLAVVESWPGPTVAHCGLIDAVAAQAMIDRIVAVAPPRPAVLDQF